MPTATVFDIYRGTTHDGPGLRTTVFFQGCPLACGWCHNPEGIPARNQVWWQPHSCIGCGLCAAACPHGALRQGEEGVAIDRDACRRCGACTAACPARALSFVAAEWTLDGLVQEALRDRPYYAATGGGVTASGGECLLQAEFVARFFAALRAEGVSTALDTSGHVPWQALAAVLPHTDYVLYDLKLADDAAHRRHTGQGNERVLANARGLARQKQSGAFPGEVWVRTPLIPGATDSQENIAALAAFIRGEMAGAVARWELCAFNNSCLAKYERLGLGWPYGGTPPMGKSEAEALRTAALACGLPPEAIVVTGILAE